MVRYMKVIRSICGIIIAMIVLSSVSVFLPIDFEKVASASSKEEYKINLNFHEYNGNHYMNTTMPGSNGVDNFVTEISFELNPALKEDLTALSIEEGIGFELHFYYTSSDTEIYVNITHNDNIIAYSNKTLDATFGRWESVDLKWTEGRHSYDFKKNDTFRVEISFANNVIFSYNETDDQGRATRLTLKCKQVKQITVETYKLDPVSKLHIKTEEYQPNMPENYSFIIVKGEIRDAFGEYDISKIDVIIKDYSTEQINEGKINAIIEPGYPVNYTFQWNYHGKIYEYSENYNITVNVSDTQNNIFTNSKRFSVTKHGVFIETPPEKNIGQGLEVTIPLEVWNTGVEKDKITLSHNEPDNWEVELSSNEINNLPAGEFEVINVNIKAPDDAKIGTGIVITVNGKTGGEGSEIKEYDMGIRLTVSDVYNIDLYLENEKSQRVETIEATAEVGVKTKFNLYIENLGTAKDKINLKLEGLPKDWKGDFKNLEDSITIESGKTVNVVLEVEPAQNENADNVANLKIIGTSENDETKKDVIFINITRTFGVLLIPNTTNQTTSDGNSVTFILTIENTGEEDRTYILEAIAPENWEILLTPNSIELKGKESSRVTLKTTPPKEALYKEGGYKIIVRATNVEDEFKSQSVDLTVNIEAKYGVEITCKRFKANVKKEEKAEYLIDIKSNCNVRTSIELSIEKIPSNWEARLDKTALVLDPYQTNQVKLTVIPSKDTSIDDEAIIKIVATVVDIKGDPTGEKKYCETITTVKGNFVDKLEEAVGNLWIVFILLIMVVVVSTTLMMRSGSEEWEEEEESKEEESEEE